MAWTGEKTGEKKCIPYITFTYLLVHNYFQYSMQDCRIAQLAEPKVHLSPLESTDKYWNIVH